MPKKRFDEGEYDPIAAEVARAAASRSAVGEGTASPPAASAAPTPQPTKRAALPPQPAANVRPLRAEPRTEAPPREGNSAPPREAAKGDLIVKRFQVSKDEDFELTAFVQRLQQRSRTKVSLSTIARALFNVAMHAEENIEDELAKGQPMRRPANDEPMELATFEDQWSQVLSAALRKTRPVNR